MEPAEAVKGGFAAVICGQTCQPINERNLCSRNEAIN
jgi:hypothetical protein